jgi:hypothetical protein
MAGVKSDGIESAFHPDKRLDWRAGVTYTSA